MMYGRFKTILIALDSFVGAFIPGSYSYETISSRAYREDWKLQSFINFIANNPNHCEESYWNGIKDREALNKVAK